MRLACLLATLLAASASPSAQVVDGDLGEWDAPLYTDASGDGDAVDFGRLWGSGDAEYLTLAVEVGAEIGLQDGNAITLYVDTDDDPATGQAIAGIGAEIRYVFGKRSGTVRLPGRSPVTIGHAAIGLATAPTVTSDRFEILLDRGAVVSGVPVFSGPTARVAIVNGTSGDALPDEPGGVAVPLSDDAPGRPPVDLGKRPGDLRVLAYNVLRDRITDPQYRAPFERIFRAVAPDVIAMTEVYDSSAGQIATLLEGMMPGTTWFGASAGGSDAHVLAQVPIVDVVALCEDPGRSSSCNVAATLDLGGDRRMHVVSMHTPCCSNDTGRQAEFDLLAAHIRDARASGAIAPGTAVVVAGDMNMVGDRRQLQTLLAGEIANTGRFGPSAAPDADGTSFADAAPRTTGRPADYTWINAGSSFGPGRLDYIVYSDALLDAGNGFALYTPGLTAAELAQAGLEAGDSDVSDHLPLVQDVALRTSTAAGDGPTEAPALSVSVFPNPTASGATVSVVGASAAQITVLDALGREVASWASASRVEVDTAGWAPGRYLVRVTGVGGATATAGLAVAR